MALNPDLRIKIRHFIQDHWRLIVLILVIFIGLIIINRFLMNRRYTGTPPTTYRPNVAVLNSKKSEVPDKVSKSFEEFIDDYIGYCNNRNYVAAWNLVSEDCKKNYFGNDYDMFVKYIQQKFDGNTKRYAIQNYSNVDDKYIYSVKIFNDFLATGLTNQSLVYQEEKFVASYDEDKNLVFNVGNYMGIQKLNYMASNDYLIVNVTNLVEKYSYSLYTLNFVNRSNHTIVIKDNNVQDIEVGLAFTNDVRGTSDETKIVLAPGETKSVQLSFAKFFDGTAEPRGIILNAVRVMDQYTGNMETAEAEVENAIDKFSMTVSF